jgi:hypothetical protein
MDFRDINNISIPLDELNYTHIQWRNMTSGKFKLLYSFIPLFHKLFRRLQNLDENSRASRFPKDMGINIT